MHAGGDIVVLPARVAAWLAHHVRLQELRTRFRGADAEVDAVLVAITLAALHWRTSGTGSETATKPEVGPGWLSSDRAGSLLGISSRAVRLAIAEGRLEADLVDGRWRITREAFDKFKAARATRTTERGTRL